MQHFATRFMSDPGSSHVRSGVKPCPIRGQAMSDPGSGHVGSGVGSCPIRGQAMPDPSQNTRKPMKKAI